MAAVDATHQIYDILIPSICWLPWACLIHTTHLRFVHVSDSTSFAGVSWRAADTLDRVIGAGAARPLVVVAPYNTGARIEEYTPVKDPGYNMTLIRVE